VELIELSLKDLLEITREEQPAAPFYYYYTAPMQEFDPHVAAMCAVLGFEGCHWFTHL
jgi:hypothetical protein